MEEACSLGPLTPSLAVGTVLYSRHIHTQWRTMSRETKWSGEAVEDRLKFEGMREIVPRFVR